MGVLRSSQQLQDNEEYVFLAKHLKSSSPPLNYFAIPVTNVKTWIQQCIALEEKLHPHPRIPDHQNVTTFRSAAYRKSVIGNKLTDTPAHSPIVEPVTRANQVQRLPGPLYELLQQQKDWSCISIQERRLGKMVVLQPQTVTRLAQNRHKVSNEHLRLSVAWEVHAANTKSTYNTFSVILQNMAIRCTVAIVSGIDPTSRNPIIVKRCIGIQQSLQDPSNAISNKTMKDFMLLPNTINMQVPTRHLLTGFARQNIGTASKRNTIKALLERPELTIFTQVGQSLADHQNVTRFGSAVYRKSVIGNELTDAPAHSPIVEIVDCARWLFSSRKSSPGWFITVIKSAMSTCGSLWPVILQNMAIGCMVAVVFGMDPTSRNPIIVKWCIGVQESLQYPSNAVSNKTMKDFMLLPDTVDVQVPARHLLAGFAGQNIGSVSKRSTIEALFERPELTIFSHASIPGGTFMILFANFQYKYRNLQFCLVLDSRAIPRTVANISTFKAAVFCRISIPPFLR
ncbi:hypothetical protein FISHEDRAFT_59266 [Fistulina hepatica ATCC 64428]|uniref:Uncharacterized protein n=1 Tax=Fistulina hepatica ATCC 64428 TaxID=1128425 RepID=A0A0D7AC37_9AGAR|nr:hypothetical protein FISHEDRAFT_59266 [Fistulina hepatica ATCC 64428]